MGGEEDEGVMRSAFRDTVLAALRLLPKTKAAEWDKPRASHSEDVTQIVLKSKEDLGAGGGQTLGQMVVLGGVLISVPAAVVYTQFM